MKDSLRKLFASLSLIALIGVVGLPAIGCHTDRGDTVGEDIEEGMEETGEEVEEAAEEVEEGTD